MRSVILDTKLPISISEICVTFPNIQIDASTDKETIINDAMPLGEGTAGSISFFENKKYKAELQSFQGSAVFIEPNFAEMVPSHVIALKCDNPYHIWGEFLQFAFPGHLNLGKVTSRQQVSFPNAVVEAGVQIGLNVEIGEGSHIGANSVICDGVKIGRNCHIGANTTIMASLIGDNVIIHNNCGIGQDGFGFAMGAKHTKIPQIGRVIIQDHVEIGAGTTIDRGAISDTMIGEGTKLDNQVQIGHNVKIGRHCVMASMAAISGSTHIGDYAIFGGQVGTVGHIKIGAHAKIAAQSGIMNEIPDGETWGGTPATPLKQFFREIAVLRKLATSQNKS